MVLLKEEAPMQRAEMIGPQTLSHPPKAKTEKAKDQEEPLHHPQIAVEAPRIGTEDRPAKDAMGSKAEREMKEGEDWNAVPRGPNIP